MQIVNTVFQRATLFRGGEEYIDSPFLCQWGFLKNLNNYPNQRFDHTAAS
jgi:hypothetical protein